MRYNITSRGLGHGSAHWCQLNVKPILEAAFRYCLVVLFPVSDWECRLRGPASLAGGRAAFELHFQQEAGNEI
ncbi:hypothetical protein ACEYW6_27025 [Nostoc sp. UIC 10607]|uniref:hypothetical protein n=1 Tax=Nostoc sp. UIC 10607 TaxID=3045935 RepID=UPI0039A0693F